MRDDKRSEGGRLYDQARTLMKAGKVKEAAEQFLESANQQPHAKTYELLGECLMQLGRDSEAIPFLAAGTLLNAGVRAPSLLAEAWMRIDRHYEASEAAKIALDRDPKNKAALKVQASVAIFKEP